MLKELFVQALTAPFIFVISFAVTYYIIPKIIWVVHSRGLIDKPDYRSSHKESTPTMAGVAFFLSIITVLFFIKDHDVDSIGLNLIAAITVVFIIGLKDDLVISTPKAKTMGQLIAIAALLLNVSMQTIKLDGFLGMESLPIYTSIPILAFVMLAIVNAYNLIDGIDGLAAIIGIVIFSGFAALFFFIEKQFYFLVALGFIGVLLAYLRYNFSRTQKIFMGDTGSLIVGFCIAFLTVRFLATSLTTASELPFLNENKIIVILAIISIPLFDTLRVIGVRILNKQSPFSPDRNHIHHILIDSGLKHYKASLFLAILNVLIISTVILLSSFLGSAKMVGVLILIFSFLLLLFYKLKENIAQKNKYTKLILFVNFML